MFRRDDGLLKPTVALKARYNTCAWCEKKLGRDPQFHHWLIKRGELPKKMYDLINVSYNVIPLHRECHMSFGNTRTMFEHAMGLAVESYGSEKILQWYNSVAEQTHLLKVVKLEDLVL